MCKSKGEQLQKRSSFKQHAGWAGSQSDPEGLVSFNYGDLPPAWREKLPLHIEKRVRNLCKLPLPTAPFVLMCSGAGTLLHIPEDCHYYLMCALLLDVHDVATARYKVYGHKHARLMRVQIKDQQLSLARDDKNEKKCMPLNIRYASPTVHFHFTNLREEFRSIIQDLSYPQMKAVQFHALEMLTVKIPCFATSQIHQYCYSDYAWCFDWRSYSQRIKNQGNEEIITGRRKTDGGSPLIIRNTFLHVLELEESCAMLYSKSCPSLAKSA
jgi:hypothetical protein